MGTEEGKVSINVLNNSAFQIHFMLICWYFSGQIFQSALSGVRNLGSLIKHVAQSITHPSGTGIRDGDRVIESLGIPPNETKHHSADMLVRLICGHLLVALIGLVIRPPNE